MCISTILYNAAISFLLSEKWSDWNWHNFVSGQDLFNNLNIN